MFADRRLALPDPLDNLTHSHRTALRGDDVEYPDSRAICEAAKPACVLVSR